MPLSDLSSNDQWTLSRAVGSDGRPREGWRLGMPDKWSENHFVEAVCVVPVEKVDELRALLAEWLDASDGLRDVDKTDREAIRAALDRVDAAKAAARQEAAKR